MQAEFNSPLYHNVTAATSLAAYSLDSAIEKEFVELEQYVIFESNHWIWEMKLEPFEVLGGIDQIIGNW